MLTVSLKNSSECDPAFNAFGDRCRSCLPVSRLDGQKPRKILQRKRSQGMLSLLLLLSSWILFHLFIYY